MPSDGAVRMRTVLAPDAIRLNLAAALAELEARAAADVVEDDDAILDEEPWEPAHLRRLAALDEIERRHGVGELLELAEIALAEVVSDEEVLELPLAALIAATLDRAERLEVEAVLDADGDVHASPSLAPPAPPPAMRAPAVSRWRPRGARAPRRRRRLARRARARSPGREGKEDEEPSRRLALAEVGA